MKRVLVIAMVLLFSSNLLAQEMSLGVKVGASFSTISNYADYKYKGGLRGGIFVGKKIDNRWEVEGDLLYVQQGGTSKTDDLLASYVNIPIVVKYYLVEGWNFHAGPQLGFMVQNNIKEELNVYGDPQKTDFSAVFGTGYDFNIGLRVEARYTMGLVDVIKRKQSKNGVFTVGVAYSFL